MSPATVFSDSPARHVVVTGTGVVTPYGRGVPAFWEGLVGGRCAVALIGAFPADDLVPARAAEVPWERGDPDPAGGYLLAAAAEALLGASLKPRDIGPDRIGVVVGTTLGGMRLFETWLEAEADTPDSEAIPYFAAAARLADAVGATGPVATTQLACASGTAAVALGARWIREGRCDVVLAGGADALCRYVVAGFNALRATADEARPFDVSRRGLVLGEGAAVVVLEAAASAGRRRAPVRARVTGAGAAGDATHMTAPDRDGRGAAHAIRRALASAGLEPEAIRFVSAHGTGTPYNDAMEARALEAVFGAGRVPVNSIKGAIGHTLGAAGALEAVLCVEVLARGLVPATVGLREIAPECAALDVVTGDARPIDVTACVSTSSGFAGANAAIVMERG